MNKFIHSLLFVEVDLVITCNKKSSGGIKVKKRFLVQKEKNIKWAAIAFGLSFLCAFISIVPFLIKGNGILTLSNDFNAQELAFNMFANNAIKKGEIFWNWNIDIGSDFITTFSFYNIGSPFFWITMIFPAKVFPYLMGWIYMLKYAVAGMTAFLYINKFAKNKKYAVVGALLYAFSGFQTMNMVFYHFHDVVALFPLLLLGLEKLMEEDNKSFFVFSVFINALLNYFFFFGEVIFLIIYYIVRFLIGKKENWKKIPLCMMEGIIGVGMSAVLFLPSCISVMSNSRVGNKLSGKDLFFYTIEDYIYTLKTFFLPGENMARVSSIESYDWYSRSTYLVLVGMTLVIAYVVINKKSWLSKILIICLVMAYVPALNNIFVLLNVELYRRWYYMPILMMALASEQVMEKPEKRGIAIGCIGTGVIVVLLTIGIPLYAKISGNVEGLTRPVMFLIFCIIAFVGTVYTGVLFLPSLKKIRETGVLVGVMGMAIVTTAGMIYSYRGGDEHGSTQEVYADVIGTGSELNEDVLPYRYKMWENYYNRGLAGYIPTRNSFCTTVSSSIIELYSELGTPRHTIGVDGPEGTDQLLGVGHVVSNVELEKEAEKVYNNGWQDIWVYNTEKLPIGFAYDKYMLKKDFEKLDSEVRASAMLDTLVIDEKDENTVKNILKKYDEKDEGIISVKKIDQYVNEHSEKIYDFKKNTTSFSAKINVDNVKYVFFSVPYDKQWSVCVNGKETEILNINGLMAIRVGKGENTIEFSYSAMWLKLGVVISCIFIGIWLVVCICEWKKYKKGNGKLIK